MAINGRIASSEQFDHFEARPNPGIVLELFECLDRGTFNAGVGVPRVLQQHVDRAAVGEPESFDRIQISGVLVGGTNILGDYTLDWDQDWVTNGVNFKRQ